MKKLYFVIFAGFLLVPALAHGAYIYLEPAQATKAVGERFTANVRLNTEGANINAVDIRILYPANLRVVSAAKGTAVQLWVEDPSFNGTSIVFTGGAPGGIQGASALIGKITFEGKAVGEGGLGLTADSSALLNDGLGTPASLRLASSVFKIEARSGTSPTTTTPKTSKTPTTSEKPETKTPEPTETEDDDTTDSSKPKKFSIFIGTDARVFAGKSFVSFFTTDAETGIDHYEVKEGDGVFKIARAPYLLSQESRKVVRVRAYDMADNYREAVYPGIIRRAFWWIINIFT